MLTYGDHEIAQLGDLLGVLTSEGVVTGAFVELEDGSRVIGVRISGTIGLNQTVTLLTTMHATDVREAPYDRARAFCSCGWEGAERLSWAQSRSDGDWHETMAPA
jgi:hypothetical protein